jgi:hypothetical protein
MDSMIFWLKSSGLIAHHARISNHSIRILRSCCQLERDSQLVAPWSQFGMEVALLK